MMNRRDRRQDVVADMYYEHATHIADVLTRRDFAGKMSWADGRRYEGECNIYVYIYAYIYVYV